MGSGCLVTLEVDVNKTPQIWTIASQGGHIDYHTGNQQILKYIGIQMLAFLNSTTILAKV